MSEIKSKLAGLKLRAAKIKANQDLRHSPSQHDISVCRDNAVLLQAHQYLAIRGDAAK